MIEYRLEELSDKLGKAETMLTHLIQAYYFSEKPNPYLLLDERVSRDDSRRDDILKWNQDYTFIYQFINVAYDYLNESSRLIESIINDC